MAGLNIEITAASKREDSSIKVTGTVLHVITDKEVTKFGLNEDKLKSAVEKYADKYPSDVYLHGPTPWGDMYKRYGWEEVKTVLTVVRSEIIEVSTKDVTLDTKDWSNNRTKSKKSGTYNSTLTQQVQNTTETNWSNTNAIEVSQSFKYSVTFLGTGGEGTTSMSYSHNWGQGGRESKAVTITASTGVSTVLDPGESVKADLMASRGVMKVRIVYHANLKGSVAINFNKKHEGHHFWGYDVSEVMKAANINNSLEFTEDIELTFFSNGRVDLKDIDQPTKGGLEDEDQNKGKSKSEAHDESEGESKNQSEDQCDEQGDGDFEGQVNYA